MIEFIYLLKSIVSKSKIVVISIVDLLKSHNLVKMGEEIPSTVINLLQSSHSKESHMKTVNISRISKNIRDQLMDFQKEGVE